MQCKDISEYGDPGEKYPDVMFLYLDWEGHEGHFHKLDQPVENHAPVKTKHLVDSLFSRTLPYQILDVAGDKRENYLILIRACCRQSNTYLSPRLCTQSNDGCVSLPRKVPAYGAFFPSSTLYH